MERKLEGLEGMTVEEMGIELMGRLIDTSVQDKPQDTFITLTLKIFDIKYSAQIPRHEATDINNIYDCWYQLISDFGSAHLSGQAARIRNQGMTIEDVQPTYKN